MIIADAHLFPPCRHTRHDRSTGHSTAPLPGCPVCASPSPNCRASDCACMQVWVALWRGDLGVGACMHERLGVCDFWVFQSEPSRERDLTMRTSMMIRRHLLRISMRAELGLRAAKAARIERGAGGGGGVCVTSSSPVCSPYASSPIRLFQTTIPRDRSFASFTVSSFPCSIA
jgi:hypothetical protein